MQDTDAFAVFDFKWTAEALANIVDNAIKYTEHGTITISAVSYEIDVYKRQEYVDENALSVTIKRLRDKLGAQKYIKTVYGIGYSWVTKDE